MTTSDRDLSPVVDPIHRGKESLRVDTRKSSTMVGVTLFLIDVGLLQRTHDVVVGDV